MLYNRSMAKERKPRMPDPAQLAFAIARVVSGDAPAPAMEPGKDPKAVERGRAGGKVGGKARAAKLTAEQRTAIAKRAAAARWNGKS